MNAIATEEITRGKIDTYGGLVRDGETPERALRRLEKTKSFSKTIGTDEGQRLLAAATRQVQEQPNGGDFKARKARGAKIGEAIASGAAGSIAEAEAIADGATCVGSNHVPGCAHFPAPAASPEPAAAGAQLLEIPIERIDVGQNVRSDVGDLQGLADSIAELGLQQPVTVTPAAGDRYTLLLGQRRVLATKLAGQATVRAIVVADPTDVLAKPGARRASEQLAENRVRLAMNPVEEAIALRAILDADTKLTQVALSRRLGMSEPWIASTLALLKAPAKVQELVRTDAISIAHAKAIAGLPAESQVRLAQSAADNGISAHSLEDSAKWERRSQGERDAGKRKTEDAGKRAIAALEEAGTAKDAVLYVNAAEWQVQDADVRKAVRAAGWTNVVDGWARSGERWSKCDCTAIKVTAMDRSATVEIVCVNEAHWREVEQDRAAKQRAKVAAEEAERNHLRTAVRESLAAAAPHPVIVRLLLKALDGYYGHPWTEYSKLTDKAAIAKLAEKVVGDRSSTGNALPTKAIVKELLGGTAAETPAPQAKHPRRRPPEAVADA